MTYERSQSVIEQDVREMESQARRLREKVRGESRRGRDAAWEKEMWELETVRGSGSKM